MARIDTLEHFLEDVANAIRRRKNKQKNIYPENFDTEILTISSVNNEDKLVLPRTADFDVLPSVGYTGLGKVTVLAVDNTIDNNIVPGNIKDGVTILGVTGNLSTTEKPTQVKTCNPAQSVQDIIPDAGYELVKVVVNPVTSSIDENIIASNIRLGTTILGVTGNLAPDKPDQTKTVNPTTSQQTITPDTGYELAEVTVNAVTSSIDNNIVASNIKNGVEILGVTGSYVGSANNEPTRTVNPTTSQQNITPASGYTGLSQVTINAVTSSVDANIVAGNIKNGVTILGVQGNYTGGGGGTSADLSDGTKFGESSWSTLPSWIVNANWDQVTNMDNMFVDCMSLTTIPLLDTSSVTSMVGTFSMCSDLATIATLDTSHVVDMRDMFSNCSSLTTVPSFNTSSVQYMR